MTQIPALQELIPFLPELVLACGAMLLLMAGVMIGERSAAIEQLLRRYAERLEHYCRLAPYNWFNFYDFWR